MRYNKEILRLQNDPDYPTAKEIFQSILINEIPNSSVLNKLYGEKKAKVISEDLNNFYELNSGTKRTPRKHISSSSTDISKKRSEIESNENFLEIQARLVFNQVPGIDVIKKIYGEYAEDIQKMFRMYLEFGLKRKCGLSSACHLNRVAGVVFAMRLDEYYFHKYITIAAMHDIIEDLFLTAVDANGKLFSLDRYDEFVELFIPPELTESVKLLTNHFNLIIYHCLKQLSRKDKSVTKENLLNELEILDGTSCSNIKSYNSKIYDLLKDSYLNSDIIETAKWFCYKNLYIVEMARLSHLQNNYRPFEIKAVDLSDNAHGRDALPMFSRIKNIIKMGIWAREGYGLKSTWLPLNNRVMEIQEDALVHAEHFVIRDLLEPQSTQDFLMSALLKIKELESIFYTG